MDRICRNQCQLIGHEDPSNLRYSQHGDSQHILWVHGRSALALIDVKLLHMAER